jgi:hypothetical protein
MAVAFDAVGGADSTGSGTASTLTWSHTAAAGAYAVVFIEVVNNTTVSSVTYGGTAMTKLGSVLLNNSAVQGILYMYGLASVASGAKTVSVTIATASLAVANSVSYTNVTSVGTPATIFGSSASPSQALTCTSGQMLVHAFGAEETATASGGTTRYNVGTAFVSELLIQDSTASATFAATLSSSSVWAGIGAVLSPPAIPTNLFFPFL